MTTGRPTVVGVVREVKNDENRVALTPQGVHDLVHDGHRVSVMDEVVHPLGREGDGSSIADTEYAEQGATLVATSAEVWEFSSIVVKVKEPMEEEFVHLRRGLVLFTYLHLAAYPRVARALVDSGTTAIAYETVQAPDGSLPLLAPMSEIAGRMAPQVGARFLERYQGGRGVLLGGAVGVEPGRVVVIGAGVSGHNAAVIARGLEAHVTVFDLNVDRLREFDRIEKGAITTRMAHTLDVQRACIDADLVIGAVLVPGAKAPKVVSAETVAAMRPGSVIVDIAIDQGGCIETSRETSHSHPVFVEHGVVHYAVGNIPGAVPRTSTYALTNVTLRYLRALAGSGLDAALADSPALAGGLNVRDGEIVHPVVRSALG
jgi:alanine dehydrogenase